MKINHLTQKTSIMSKNQTTFKRDEIIKIPRAIRGNDEYKITDVKPYRGTIMIVAVMKKYDGTYSKLIEKFTLRENGYFVEQGCPMGYTSYHKIEFQNK